MKTAINQWAFPSDTSTTEAISLAKRIGFEAFEVCVGDDNCLRIASSEAEATAVRRHADTVGIKLSSVACGLGCPGTTFFGGAASVS